MKVDAPTITRITNLTTNGYVCSAADGTLSASADLLTEPVYNVVAYDPADMVSADGDRTTAGNFIVLGRCYIVGGTFRTAIVGAHTMQLRVWDRLSLALHASVNVSCSGPGLYSALFGTPWEVPCGPAAQATRIGHYLRISIWETTGTKYTYCTTCPTYSNGVTVSRLYKLYTPNMRHEGDGGTVCPADGTVGQYYPIDPLIVEIPETSS